MFGIHPEVFETVVIVLKAINKLCTIRIWLSQCLLSGIFL